MRWTLLFLLLSVGVSFGQLSKTLTFEYVSSRNGQSVSASGYLGDFTLKIEGYTECCFGLGFCRFRVAKTALIDSITFEGGLTNMFTDPMRQQVMESQKYWKYADCSDITNHWVTVLVYVAYYHGENCSSTDNEIFQFKNAFWFKLFENKEQDQIELFKSEWLLAPVYVVSMR